MRYQRTTRRLFLTGAGGAVVALPFLPSLVPKALRSPASAQASAPRRFVAIKTYNGTPVLDFFPGAQPGYQTHAGDGRVRVTQQLAEPTGRHSNGTQYYGHSAPLSDFSAAGVSNVFGPEFNAYHDQMLLLRGLDLMPNLNHNHGGILGNFGLRTAGVGGALPGAQINVTIDQVMARSSAVYPVNPLGPRVLHLGSRRNTFSYEPRDPNNLLATGEGAVQQAQAYVNPRVAFDAVLGGFGGGGGTTPPEPGVSVRLVDRVLEDYRRASNGPHLSSADRQLLEQHMTRLSELEARLGQGQGVSCDSPTAPGSLDTGDEFSVDVGQIEQLFDDMVDLTVAALACDVTRVVTLDVTKMVIRDGGDVFGMGDSQNPNSSGRNNWHNQAHIWDGNAIRWLGLGAQWVAERVILRLLNGLSQIQERDGQSLLHHAMVLWGNELSFNHINYGMPTALWGQGGGALRTGRYIDYIDHNQPVRFRQHDGPVIEGVQYNRLMVTLLQAMGLGPAEYEISSGRGFGETRAVDKDGGFATDYDDSNVGQPLPDIG